MHRNRNILTALLVLLCARLAQSQQRPLLTEDADTVKPGNVRVQFGLEFLQDQPYPLSGLTGDLTRVGVLGLNAGLSRIAQFEVRGTLRDFLNVSSRADAPNSGLLRFAGNSTSDVGNFSLATKIKMRSETQRFPALSFRFSVELPNASNESGLGNDTTNFLGSLIVGKRLGRVNAFANLGLAIMDRPTELASQSDKFLYGAAAIISLTERINAVAEVNGLRGNSSIGTEDRAQVRIGAQIRAAGLRWDIGGIAGLNRFSPNSGLVFGVTYEFTAFKVP